MDVTLALRLMKRSAVLSAAAVVTLAVGIGPTTAVLTFVAGLMAASRPASGMERLVAVWSQQQGEPERKGLVTPADFLEWSARVESLEVAAAWQPATFNVSGQASAVRSEAQRVSPGYMRVFGWEPMLGRAFTDEDARPGAPRVVVVSHPFWQTMLGGRADAVGQMLKLDGEPAVVVGVLPRIGPVTGFFVPLSLADRAGDRTTRSLFVFARMRHGMGIERVRAEFNVVGAALERDFPATNAGRAVNVTPLSEEFVGPQARLVFAMLLGMAAIVLLIGCVNVANLLLARGVSRRTEMALRLALGAGGWRIVRQLLIESAVLAFAGGLLSLVVARWTLAVLLSLGAADTAWFAGGGMNARVLALTVAITCIAAMGAGLIPALAARGTRLATALNAGGRSAVRGSRRVTHALVGAQVALAVALLVVAGLGTRTLAALERLDAGFDLDNVLTASVTLPEITPPSRTIAWFEQALMDARALPGVVSAGATSRLPFAGSRWNPNQGLEIEGQPAAPDESRFAVDYIVTPELIETLGIPLREGRTLTAGDGAGAPAVAVVSETMARRFWPTRSPLGARFRRGGDAPGAWRTVVGVVGDIRNDDADQPPLPYVYLPFAQQPANTMTLTLRTPSDPAALASPLRAAMAALDADQPLYDVRTMREVWEADLRETRILMQLMAALALVALGLAGLGVWGVLAYSVGQRRREIGVRVALGASAPRVAALIAAQGLLPVGAGLSAGLAAGLALATLMRSILFQVSPTDSATVLTAIGAIALVAVLAASGPAWRAARLDPVTALRMD